MKNLVITYGDSVLFDGPAGKFSWAESGSGGIKIEAEPLRTTNGKLNGGGALTQILSAVTAGTRNGEARKPEEEDSAAQYDNATG